MPLLPPLRGNIAWLRQALGEGFLYVFRHFSNEAAHPGATSIGRGGGCGPSGRSLAAACHARALATRH